MNSSDIIVSALLQDFDHVWYKYTRSSCLATEPQMSRVMFRPRLGGLGVYLHSALEDSRPIVSFYP